MNRAIFVDKDGTLVVDVPYNVNPDLITLSPGAGQALRRFKDAGYLLVVVSNQSGIAKGLFEESALLPVQQRIDELLAPYGVTLDGFYFCPHWEQGSVERYSVACDCRKPKAGLFWKAANDMNIDLSHSWMIGDILADSEAGKRAGCRTLLIEKSYDPIFQLNEQNCPDFIVHNWNEAREIVLSGDGLKFHPVLTWLAG